MPTFVDPFLRRRTLAVTDGGAWWAFVRRWGISVASFVSGLVALVIFRRGVPHVAWIVGYIVVLWLAFTVLTQARERLESRGRRRVVRAGDYTVQSLYHGLLLFVIPGYFASTTFDGMTAPFFGLLVGATLLTTVDPWYRAVIQPRPGLGRLFFAFSLFAGLNLALPLMGMPPAWALAASATLPGLLLTPAYIQLGRSWRGAALRAGVFAALAGSAARLLLPAIPPAPLQLVRPTLARGVTDLEPVEPVSRVTIADLRAWGEVVAYTPVSAPEGLRQPIEHRWRHEGREMGRVRLPTPVRGGRAAGFRTFSRKVDFPADAQGRWTVDVLTATGQLIGRLRFTVDP